MTKPVTKPSKKSSKHPDQDAPVPFDVALKKVWASPPQPKKAKKKAKKKR
jgi:hypothetical protein